MKIGIPVSQADGKGDINMHFGRSPYFAIVEIDQEKITNMEVIPNTAQHQSGGAGITGSQLVANQGVDAIIAPNMGPRAVDIFNQLGIELFQSSGTVEDAVKNLIAGKLTRFSTPTGPAHQGMGGDCTR